MSVRLWRASGALFRLPAAVIGCALVVRVLDEWWSYLPAGTIGDHHRDLGFSYAQSGWLLALLTLGGVVGAPLAPLADRGRRRLLAVAGALGLAAGLAAFALGAPFAVLAVCAAVLGAASDLVILPLESALAEHAGDELDRWLGRQHLVTWFGDFIGPALLALGAATALGWRGVFAVTAAIYVAFGAVLSLIEFPEAVPSEQDGPAEPVWRVARSLLRERELLLLAGAELLLLPLDEAFLGFAVARRAGDGGAVAQSLAGGVVVGGIAGALLVARKGLDRRRTAAGGAAMVAGAFGAALAPALVVQVSAMAALGAGTAVVWAKVHHRTLTVIPEWTATVPTLVGLLATPALLIPVGMGALSDRTSITAAMVGAAVLTVPLAAIVVRLGGDRVSAEELDVLDA